MKYRCVHNCRPDALEVADAGHELILTCNNCGTREHRPKVPADLPDRRTVHLSPATGRVVLPASIRPTTAGPVSLPTPQGTALGTSLASPEAAPFPG